MKKRAIEIEEIFENLSDEQLILLVKELNEFKLIGHLSADSGLRKLIQRVSDISDKSFHEEFLGVSFKILETAALKWVSSFKGNAL